MGFHLEAVEGRWIMACGNHDAARELPAANFVGDVRRRKRPIQRYDAKAVGSDYFCSRARKCLGLKTHIEPDENRTFTSLDGLEIFSCCLCGNAHVLECKCVRNNRAPTVGSELDGCVHMSHNDEKSVTTLLSPSTTPQRRLADRPI